MKYLIVLLVAFSASSAFARLKCTSQCTLTGPDVKETQSVYYHDGFLQKDFELEDLKGQRVYGGFGISGDPNTSCGSVVRVSIQVGDQTHSWQDSEVIFNIDGAPHKFSCGDVVQSF